MIVETDFLTHWKTRMLVAELGDKSAPLYVLALWLHCQQRKTDTFTNLTPAAIKSICQCDHDDILGALERCGFVRHDGANIIVHGWAETNAQLIANWQNGAKGGRKPSKQQNPNPKWVNPSETQIENGLTQTEPITNPSLTQAEPIGNPSGTDRVDREDKSREEKRRKKETPFPPLGDLQSKVDEFIATWNAKCPGHEAHMPTDLGSPQNFAALFSDPAWWANYPKALARFPLRYFPAGMNVLKFLQPEVVGKILAGDYDWNPDDRDKGKKKPAFQLPNLGGKAS